MKKPKVKRDDCPTCRGMGWIPVPYAFRVKCGKCGNDFQPKKVDVQMSLMESQKESTETQQSNERN